MELELKVGKFYLFRTVTMIYSGELVHESEDKYVLKKASWIADTGRWADNLVSCEFDEVEPYPSEKPVWVHKGGMMDIVEIEKLPMVQK